MCADAITGLESLCRTTGNTLFTYKKSLQIARHKKDIPALSTESKLRNENGFDTAFLEEEELAERFGVNAPAGLLTALAGDMDAYLLTHQLLQFNRRRGLRVFDRTGAIHFRKSSKGHHVTTAEGKQIRCYFIVYANGYEAAKMVPAKLVDLRSTYVTISESLSNPPPHWGDDVLIWTTGDPYLYMRSTQDNRILVGGRDEDLVSPARRDKLISSKAKALKKDFSNLFPHIPFKTEFSWTGIFASTPDGLPIIGKLADRRTEYIMLGYGGNGIPFSLIAARILTDLISGRSSPNAGLFSTRRL
jgi:glycine/D-amino acid oxidase-like deaminating enzyme